jgi:tRNA (cmo5U34)-methyltransferase
MKEKDSGERPEPEASKEPPSDRTEEMSPAEGPPSVGDNIVAFDAAWSFSGLKDESFTDHIRRSVPFYDVGHDLVCKVSDFFVTSTSSSVCYELGTSTATLLAKLASHNEHKKNVQWVGIDNVPEMIEEGREKVKDLENVELVAGDIITYEYEPSDFIVAYLTIQFVPPRLRQDLIDRIYETLNWGGGFVMFDKVRAPDARFQDMMTSIYNDYKVEQGYGPEEIINKARSLKGLLEPFSTEGNLGLLRRAGFVDIVTVMKYVCFEGFLAIK